jgi:hypothetical protein
LSTNKTDLESKNRIYCKSFEETSAFKLIKNSLK